MEMTPLEIYEETQLRFRVGIAESAGMRQRIMDDGEAWDSPWSVNAHQVNRTSYRTWWGPEHSWARENKPTTIPIYRSKG